MAEMKREISNPYANLVVPIFTGILDFLDFIRLLCFHLSTYVVFVFKRLFSTKKSLEHEIILVTGSGRGIGREICLQLATTGAKIVCWSRSAPPNEEVVSEIRKRGGMAYAYTVDVSNKMDVQRTADMVKRDIGNVTIVINNAGIMKVSSFLDSSERDIESLYNVNVFSNFWILKQFLPSMIEKSNGHLVTVCSASAILPTRNITLYSSTKHAIHGYMEALRDELRYHPKKPDIKVTTAYPFYCATEMLDNSVPNTRFPNLFPIHPPKVVAERIVDGIQRNLEYVYVPATVGWLAMFSWLVPPRSVEAYGDFLRLNIEPESPVHVKGVR